MISHLPPLPEPFEKGQPGYYRADWTQRPATPDTFIAEHMTAYGLQCAEAERARCAKICRDIAQEELDRRQHYGSSVASTCANFIERK